ncbi:MAG: prepilin-type N-terminal cleavage/methylation domain-containing protein [Myxococcota bacterium]|nr:prepilin-type N-terminal cleavage/methylation domain-containing protein [Myxococcota bacterium]
MTTEQRETRAATPGRRGFTLIELAVTVAIVGVLATIAIPQYYHLLVRSKRAELPMNLDAIRTIEVGYAAEWGLFTSCALAPVPVPGRKTTRFHASITTSLDWNMLGWTPDGKVYGQYEVNARNENGNSSFIGDAYGDIDGDGNLSNYRASDTYKPIMLTSNTIF